MRPITDNKSLIEWLETKDPNEGYPYINGFQCLLAQYFQEKTGRCRDVGIFAWTDTSSEKHRIPDGWNAVARGEHAFNTKGHTFGAALERARTLAECSKRDK